LRQIVAYFEALLLLLPEEFQVFEEVLGDKLRVFAVKPGQRLLGLDKASIMR